MEQENKMSDGTKLFSPVIFVTLAVLVIGGFLYFKDNPKFEMQEQPAMMETEESVVSEEEMMENKEESTTTEEEKMMEKETSMMVGEVKEFTVVGTNFQFDVPEIKVNQGDTVRIIFQNGGGVHDWVIDEFDTRTSILNTGEKETIEFVATEKGTFEYYCSVGMHRQNGMWGNLIVE